MDTGWTFIAVTVGIDCLLGALLWYQIRIDRKAYAGFGSIFRHQMEEMDQAYAEGNKERFEAVQQNAHNTVGIVRTLLT